MLLRITAILCVLGFLCLNDASAQPTTVRPYKFGFTIDEQQHRSEQRDERGIVMGEFGFITADGIYHVTVYATDENGKFRILAMRNYPYKPVEAKPTTTTTELPRPATTPKTPPRYNFNTDACSGCSLLNGKGSKPSGIAPNTATKTEIRPLSQPLPLDVPRPGSVEEIEALRQVVPDLFTNIDQVQAITGQLPPNLRPPTQTQNTQPGTYTQTQPQLVQSQAATRPPLIVTGKVSSSSRTSSSKKSMNVNFLVGEQAKTPAAAPNKLGLPTPTLTLTQNTQPGAHTQTTPIDTHIDRKLLDEVRIGSAVEAKRKLDAQKQGAAQAPTAITGSVPSRLTTPTKYTQVDYAVGDKAKTPTTPTNELKLTTPTKYTQVDYNVGDKPKTPTPGTNELSSGGAPNAIATPLKVKLDRQVLKSPSGGLFTSANLPLTPNASPVGGALASPLGNALGGLGGALAAKLPSSAVTGKPNVGISNQISGSASPLIAPPANAKYSAGNTKASQPILSAVKESAKPFGNSGAIVSPADFGALKDNATPLYALNDTPESAVGRITPGSLLGSTTAGPKKQNKYVAGISDALNNVIVPMKAAVVTDRQSHQPTQAHTHDPQAPQHKNNLNKIATQPSQQPTAKQPQTQTGRAPQTPTNTAFNTPNAVVPLTQTQTNTQQPGQNAIGSSNAQAPQAGPGSRPNTVSGYNAPQADRPEIDLRFDKTAKPQAAGKPSTQSGSPARGSAGSSGSTDDAGDLYRFKYILDYNGHTETGGGNGNKVGNYFVIGDDDVERTIEYIANEFGFQPQVRWRKVNAKELPKDNTLKDYEFTWFKKE